MRTIIAAATLAVMLAGGAQAQRAPVKLTCTFDRYADPRSGTVSKVKDVKEWTLEFTVDRTSRKAYMVGNAGVAEVHLVAGSLGMTFLEVLGTGAVQSTTVHNDGSAVHSRHTMMSHNDEVFPSQAYGTCRW